MQLCLKMENIQFVENDLHIMEFNVTVIPWLGHKLYTVINSQLMINYIYNIIFLPIAAE